MARTPGRIQVVGTRPVRNREDLAAVYTPGVADDVRAIAEDPASAREHTTSGRSVAIVSDGSAVLGLGDVGPRAALPVLEGKAALLSSLADLNGWPICLHSREPDDIVRTLVDLAPGFAAINLEDIAAPRCFVVRRNLANSLDIPVFHDDQQGTAIITLAALRNALRVVEKTLDQVRVVVSGAGAAGSAVARLLLTAGVGEVRVCDRRGLLHPGRTELGGEKRWLAENTGATAADDDLGGLLAGADVFVGVSAPDLLDAEDVSRMAKNAVVFALANPDPEIPREVASEHAAVVATGSSEDPNQINNALVFPGLLRGLVDGSARNLTPEMELRAADAIAGLVPEDELTADHIVPDIFDERLVPAVASSVADPG
ncbi:MAG: malic enzyme-like NAD(P)-binding protein [Actinocatenispora sp.]